MILKFGLTDRIVQFVEAIVQSLIGLVLWASGNGRKLPLVLLNFQYSE